MLSITASYFLFSAPQKWTAGDLTVEVSKETSSWRVLLPNATEVYQSKGIEAISYVLIKGDELSMTGTKAGRTFFTKLKTSNKNTLHVETTFHANGTKTANSNVEEFSVPEGELDDQSQTGLAPGWKTPFLLYTAPKSSTAIWPDLANWNIRYPMPASLEPGVIGYRNATLNQDGTWQATDANRAIPSTSQVSFYIQASDTSLTEVEIANQIFAQQANTFRPQAFPQQSPMTTSADVTYKFRKQTLDTYHGLFEIEQSTTDNRWKKLADNGINTMGLPAGQNDKVTLDSSINAFRAAAAMYSWGVDRNQSVWIDNALQMMNLIVAGSPEDGFASTVSVSGGELLKPASLALPEFEDEAATAFFAAQILAEFPDNPIAAQLTTRIAGVLKRIPNSPPSPEVASLIAACSNLETLPASVRQLAVENLIQTQATFAITAENANNPWTLEAFYWLRKINPSLYGPEITQLVNDLILKQNLTDSRDQDRLATFGAFRTTSGEISPQTPQFASILGRTAVLMNNPDWLDRAAFALRSAHSTFESSIGALAPELAQNITWGTSVPGFGNVIPNQPDPRTSFEACEGLLNAASWELMRQTRGAYVFPDGKIVGVDGLAASPDNKLRNTLFSNPLPFSGVLQDGLKTNGTNDRPAILSAPGYPTISTIIIEPRGTDLFVVASPGLSTTRVEESSKGNFIIAGRTIPATSGSVGFEAKLPALKGPIPITFVGQVGDIQLNKTVNLAQGAPVTMATDLTTWYRSGDYRWSGHSSIEKNGQTWLSTGDLGNGSEATWMTGLYYTPWLTATGKSLEFTASGEGDCRILLIDSETDTPMETWFPEEGTTKVSFDLSTLTGRKIKIVIQDRDDKGLVRISNLKVTN